MIPHIQASSSGSGRIVPKVRRARLARRPRRRRSTELSAHERCDGTTEAFRLLLGFGLREHSDNRLRAARAHEHAAPFLELFVFFFYFFLFLLLLLFFL